MGVSLARGAPIAKERSGFASLPLYHLGSNTVGPACLIEELEVQLFNVNVLCSHPWYMLKGTLFVRNAQVQLSFSKMFVFIYFFYFDNHTKWNIATSLKKYVQQHME